MKKRLVAVSVALGLAAAFLVSGCTAQHANPSVTNEPLSTHTVSASATATPTPTATSTYVSDDPADYTVTDDTDPAFTDSEVAFYSPSKNIECGIVLTGSSASLWGCTVHQHSWQAPAAQSGDICFGKGEDCGSGLEAQGTGAVRGRGEFVFESQRAIDGPGPIDVTVHALPYGHSVTAAGVTCVSLATGMMCSNATSGHGFTLSASVYEKH